MRSHFDVLRGLYFGSAANADITSREERELLHVRTPLDRLIPELLRQGRDLVLTGNPGDGKSHLARALQEAGSLGDGVLELDLSAREPKYVVAEWERARRDERPFILCGNEGPLKSLLPELAQAELLSSRASELSAQLGRLVSPGLGGLPSEPEGVYLVDLADRNVADRELIGRCLERVCTFDFLPRLEGLAAQDCSAGLNLTLLASCEVSRERLSIVLEHAAQRRGVHVTFRELWSSIAFSITGGRTTRHLKREARDGTAGLGALPLDQLCRRGAQGSLIHAVRDLADPGAVPVPGLDEELWTQGEPRRGDWHFDGVEVQRPADLWTRGAESEAIEQLRRLKRYVLLAHDAGELILEALQLSDPYQPSTRADGDLLETATKGIGALFLSPGELRSAPQWLADGVPLWVSHTYRQLPRSERPHVACDSLDASEFRVVRPVQVPWLREALGPLLEVAWLEHEESGFSLSLTPEILRHLHVAISADGPVVLPEVVGRFLEQLAGWREVRSPERLGEDHFALLERPRGEVAFHGRITELADGLSTYG